MFIMWFSFVIFAVLVDDVRPGEAEPFEDEAVLDWLSREAPAEPWPPTPPRAPLSPTSNLDYPYKSLEC